MTQGQITALRRLAWGTATLVLAAAALRWLGPFLVGFALAAGLERGVVFCQERLGWKRGFAAAVLTLGFSGFTLALGFWGAAALGRQACRLARVLPQTLVAMDGWIQQTLAALCPPETVPWLSDGIEKLMEELPRAAIQLSGEALSYLGQLAGAIPKTGFFLGVTILATAYTSACFPQLRGFLRRQLPPVWTGKMDAVAETLHTAAGQWLRAQLVLVGSTFLVLLGGFWLIGQSLAPVMAAGIAVMDALPVLGVGLVLLPWAVGCLALGQVSRAVALAVLWGVVSIVRSLLEPKVMAAQAGLPPLAALAAMYGGFSALGVVGMVVCPLVLLVVWQLHQAGVVRLWK